MRSLVLPLFVLSLCDGQVTITPSQLPVVGSGGTVRFTANRPVTWSLAAGSKGTIDPDGTYHAPAHVDVKQKLAGCQVLPNDHVFNTRIDDLPLHPRSAQWINNGIDEQGGRSIKYAASFGLNVVTNETPLEAMKFFYTPGNNGSFPFLPFPPGSYFESGRFVSPHAGFDRHVVSVNRETCFGYEIYNYYSPGANPSCTSCTSQSGLAYDLLKYQLPSGSTDAGGLPLLPLVLRIDEIRSGAINHALRFTRVHPDQAYLWPATASAMYGFIDGRMQMGARLRLKSTFDTSGFSATAQVLLTQLKRYGIILADAGYNWEIQAMVDIGADPVVMAALKEVTARVTGADMEVVDQSGLMKSPSSGEVLNSGEIVIATDASNPEVFATQRVILKGITIGVPNNWEVIQSGTSKQFGAWVTGSANSSVQWTMSPALGTLTEAGLYTAPAVTSPQTTRIIATSAADPLVTAEIAVTVIPAGKIRVAINPSSGPGVPRTGTAYGPDSQGNLWWRDMASGSPLINYDEWYGAPWPKVPDITLYYGAGYTASDWTHRFNVPNGNYKITLKMARANKIPDDTTEKGILEAQGRLVRRNFDMKVAGNNVPATPIDVDLPAKVVDGTLYFTIRHLREAEGTLPKNWPILLSAYEIAPDPTPPRITIDPPSVPTVTAKQTVQFYAIGWYMPETVTWSISPAIGTIDANGLYRAPQTPVPTDTVVTVKATSTTDPTKIATVQMTLAFGLIEVKSPNTSIVRGLSEQFTASISGSSYGNVNWTISPQVGMINGNGLYTSPEYLSADTTIRVTATSRDDPSRSGAKDLLVAARMAPIRIDCGNTWGDVTDAEGNIWSKDYGFSTPTLNYHETVQIAQVPPGQLPVYQSSRYRYSNEDFYYSFAVPNGAYKVTLKFADYSFTEPGHYNFDVKINGKRELQNFDPDAVNGAGRIAVDRTFYTVVNNRQLKIDFVGHQGGALVNGIEILAVDALPPDRQVTGSGKLKGKTN